MNSGRVGYAEAFLGKVHPRFKALPTPCQHGRRHRRLLTGKTGEIITIACFAYQPVYIISMVAAAGSGKKRTELWNGSLKYLCTPGSRS